MPDLEHGRDAGAAGDHPNLAHVVGRHLVAPLRDGEPPPPQVVQVPLRGGADKSVRDDGGDRGVHSMRCGRWGSTRKGHSEGELWV